MGDTDLIFAPIKSSQELTDPLYKYLRSIEKKKTDHELARLLYVAITRAKKSVHLFSVIPEDQKPKKGCFLEILWPHFRNKLDNLKHTTKDTSSDTPTRTLYRLVDHWHLPTLSNGITPEFSLTPFQAGFNKALVDEIEINASRIIGTLIHEALDKLSRDITPHPNFWIHRAKSLGLENTDIEFALSQIKLATTNTLNDSMGSWIIKNHLNAESELPISTIENGEVIHLIIDRTFIDENNERWIIDYKTATPNDIELNTFLNLQKQEYESQLKQYATALSKIDNRKTHCCLYFPLIPKEITWQYATISLEEQENA